MRFAICCILGVLLVGCGKRADEGTTKADNEMVKRLVQKLAFEAYPSWAAAHPDKACPDSLAELDEYLTAKVGADPWGGTYKMTCGPTNPPGVRGMGVMSAGPDRKEGTADDIKSWE
jgi:hypothetical protein